MGLLLRCLRTLNFLGSDEVVEFLSIYPLHEMAKCTGMLLFQFVCVTLTFDEFTLECCSEDRRVAAGVLPVELKCFFGGLDPNNNRNYFIWSATGIYGLANLKSGSGCARPCGTFCPSSQVMR
jgi:hypothetical protein